MITILGANGFIGSAIVRNLISSGSKFYAPGRGESVPAGNLGDIIYCIGMTSDFRLRPYETTEAHVCYLKTILENCTFNSLTYLSSTRVYIHNSEEKVTETSRLSVDIEDPDDLYNLTKLTGERLCLSSNKKTKIARISNVFSPDTISNDFLFSIIDEIKKAGRLTLDISSSSGKDYIPIDDVVTLLIKIARDDEEEIYNLSSGINTSISEIVDELKNSIEDFKVVNYGEKKVIFPEICNKKIIAKFNYSPKSLIHYISQLINSYNKNVQNR